MDRDTIHVGYTLADGECTHCETTMSDSARKTCWMRMIERGMVNIYTQLAKLIIAKGVIRDLTRSGSESIQCKGSLCSQSCGDGCGIVFSAHSKSILRDIYMTNKYLSTKYSAAPSRIVHRNERWEVLIWPDVIQNALNRGGERSWPACSSSVGFFIKGGQWEVGLGDVGDKVRPCQCKPRGCA